MKNFLCSILISCLTISFYQCQQSNAPETILSGKLMGFNGDSIKINYIKYDYLEGPEELWVKLDSIGQFKASLPVNSLKEFKIILDEKQQSPVYLKSGWNTDMSIYLNEEGKMDSTTFAGDGAEENMAYNKINSIIFEAYNHMGKEPAEFMAVLDSIDQVMNAHVDVLKEADQEFVAMLRNNVAYHKMGRWESYAMRKFDYAGKDRPDSLKDYSSQFDQLIVFDNPDLLKSTFYKAMMEDHFNEMVRDSIDFDALMEANDGDQDKAIEEYYSLNLNLNLDFADSLIQNPEVKAYHYYHTFLRNMGLPSIDPLKENFEDRFKVIVTDTAKINFVQDQIAQVEKLLPGKPAPNFIYPDTTGTMVGLADFRGKYVYIDVWATWCGPCIREIPKLKELEEEFGDEIAFVSVSIDPEKETWRKYVREKGLTGFQIYSEGSWQAEINDLYMIQGIPRFIMVDPDGNLVDADASRPSSENTRKLFEEWTAKEKDQQT